jgi:hypothetical protein
MPPSNFLFKGIKKNIAAPAKNNLCCNLNCIYIHKFQLKQIFFLYILCIIISRSSIQFIAQVALFSKKSHIYR